MKTKSTPSPGAISYFKDNASELFLPPYQKVTSRFIKRHLKNYTPSEDEDNEIENLTSIPKEVLRYKKTRKKEFYKLYRELTRKKSDENIDDTLARLQSFLSDNKDLSLRWRTLNGIGNFLLYRDRAKHAEAFFQAALKEVDKSNRNLVVFNIIWSSIYNEDYRSAYIKILDHNVLKNFDTTGDRLRFWSAYTLLKLGKTSDAHFRFKQLLSLSPVSYYSILALQFTNEKDQNSISAIKKIYYSHVLEHDQMSAPKKKFEITSMAPVPVKRILVWMKTGYTSYLDIELNDLFSSIPENYHRPSLYQLAEMFNGHRQYLQSFKLLNRSLAKNDLPFTPKVMKKLFPFAYFKSIKKHTKQKIEPLVILSLIRQESAFDPNAKSIVGARGLMQLMPATARFVKRGVRKSQLANPQTNIKIGVKYFKYLLKKFDNNVIHTLAAYNAGEHRVRRWKRELFHPKNPLFTIESIPFKETRLYVKLIYRNLFFYNLLDSNGNEEDSFKGDFLSWNQISE
jgi:soluble lytic murein transglycosylase